MEAGTLKKAPLYIAVAVVLGLSLILVPLFKEVKTEKDYAMPLSLAERLEKLEGTYGVDAPRYSVVDFGILLSSFAIALGVYLLFKCRTH